MQEVSGSIPLGSTTSSKSGADERFSRQMIDRRFDPAKAL